MRPSSLKSNDKEQFTTINQAAVVFVSKTRAFWLDHHNILLWFGKSIQVLINNWSYFMACVFGAQVTLSFLDK